MPSTYGPCALPACALLLLSFFEQKRIKKEVEVDQIKGECTSVHHFDSNHNDKLIHLVSPLQTEGTSYVLDELFPYIQSERAIAIRRIVEFLQYQQKGSKKDEYSLVWTADHVDSSQFKDAEKCNKRSNIVSITNYNNMSVTCGGYIINRNLLKDLDNYTPLSISNQQLYNLSQYFGAYGSQVVQHSNWIYIFPPEFNHFSCSPTDPPANTMRMRFEVAHSCVVSVLGKQCAYDILPWRDIHVLYVGTQPIVKMLQPAGTITSSVARIAAILMLWFILDFYSAFYGTILSPKIYAHVIAHTYVAATLLVFTTIALNYLFFKPIYSFLYISPVFIWYYFVIL